MAKKKSDQAAYTGYGPASAAEVKEIMTACHKAAMPICLVSEPGTGKSASVIQYCIDNGLGVPWIVLLSTADPTDVKGMPSATTREINGVQVPVTSFHSPDWIARAAAGEIKAIFFDEFSNAPSSCQAAALTLIGSRMAEGGISIPGDCLFVLAMNPEDSAASYEGITSPMANRITFVSYKPTDEEVYEGLSGGWFTEEQQAQWSPAECAWRNRIVQFLRHTSGAYILMENNLADGVTDSEAPAYLQPDSEYSSSEREILTTAWASPRSWDNVARILSYTGFEKEVTPLQERILAGTVGRQATVPLVEFVHQHRQIDPFSLIKNPELQEWRVSDADGATYNDILEIARAVNEAVPQCDGKDGRPTVVEALEFYDKVIDLGGGAHFMTTYCQSNELGGHYFKHVPIPEGMTRNEWTKKINDILKKFRTANLIPDNAQGASKPAQ